MLQSILAHRQVSYQAPQKAQKIRSMAFGRKMCQAQFSGLHEDAIAGGDVLLMDTHLFRDNIEQLIEKIRQVEQQRKQHLFVFDADTKQYTGKLTFPMPLKVRRDEQNPSRLKIGANTALPGQPDAWKAIGYVPDSLAQPFSRLMDKPIAERPPIVAYLTVASLTSTDPMEVRLECLSQPGKTPSIALANEVAGYFQAARQEPQGHLRIFTEIPELIQEYSVPGARGKLTERLNQERGQATYFYQGSLISRMLRKQPLPISPIFEASTTNLPDTVKRKVCDLLNAEIGGCPHPPNGQHAAGQMFDQHG